MPWGLYFGAAWRSRARWLTACSYGWLHCAADHQLRHFQAPLLSLQVTTYPNGSILVAGNGSAVLASSNATSNTSSADDVFGTQPLERYIGEGSAVQHALPCSQQARQR